MQAAVYYRDDLDRATNGLYGWTVLGRPLASIFMQLISASGNKLADIFPYNILICSAFLAGCAYFICNFLKRNNINFASLIASLVIFNPFFLQNVAYRFDGAAMSLGLMLAVYAFCHNYGNTLKGSAVTITSLVASISCYQTDANIFIALTCISLLAKKNIKTLKSIIIEVYHRGAYFILSYVIYMLTIAKIFANDNSRNNFIPLSFDGLAMLAKTLIRMKNMIMLYATQPVIFFYIFAITIGLICFTVNSFKNGTVRISWIKIVLSTIIFLVSLMGPSILLTAAPVAPRTFVSFSILIVAVGILLSSSGSKVIFLSILPVIPALSFSAQLGNAIKAQRQYETNIMYSIRDDLRKEKGIEDVRFAGQLKLSPFATLISRNSPLTREFISPASEWLAAFQLHEAGVKNVYLGYGKESFNKNLIEKSNKNAIVKSYDYIIYKFNNTAIVELGNF